MVIRNLGEPATRARARAKLDPGLGLIGISAYHRRTDWRGGGLARAASPLP